MKLLERLRSMGHGVEPGPDAQRIDTVPGLNRDDYLDPPGDEMLEPVLGVPGPQQSVRQG